MSPRRFLLMYLCLTLACGGCAAIQDKPSRADIAEEPQYVGPAPVSVDTDVALPEPGGIPSLVERLRTPSSVTRTVIRGRVQRLSATERTVPAYIWPEADEQVIVTRVTVSIDEVLCGTLAGSLVDFSYVGGRIGRRWLRTSVMTLDLSPGEEYVLMLSRVGQEYFLVGGRYELLKPAARDEDGRYRDHAGREVTRAVISGACR